MAQVCQLVQLVGIFPQPSLGLGQRLEQPVRGVRKARHAAGADQTGQSPAQLLSRFQFTQFAAHAVDGLVIRPKAPQSSSQHQTQNADRKDHAQKQFVLDAPAASHAGPPCPQAKFPRKHRIFNRCQFQGNVQRKSLPEAAFQRGGQLAEKSPLKSAAGCCAIPNPLPIGGLWPNCFSNNCFSSPPPTCTTPVYSRYTPTRSHAPVHTTSKASTTTACAHLPPNALHPTKCLPATTCTHAVYRPCWGKFPEKVRFFLPRGLF